MAGPLDLSRLMLALASLLSSLAFGFAPERAHAHEVMPTVADLQAEGGLLLLDLRLTLEAFVARIDLDGLEDTNEAGAAEAYDALRAQPPEALSAAARDWAPAWLDTLDLHAGEVRLPLRLEGVEVPEVGDTDLPRISTLRLVADLPPGAETVILAWPDGAGDLVLRQQGVDDPYTGYIEGGASSAEIGLAGGGAGSGWDTFLAYVPVGFDHIVPKGLDHILFVLGLFFLSTRLGPLLWQVSAFTLAHTITLALGALGWASVSPAIVEPLIAASIVYVAVENIATPRLHAWRPAVVFGFGLLHGLGFASVLDAFGLPEGQFVPALLGFNIGVELGQLAVIALAFLAVGAWFRNAPWYRQRIAIPASVLIALVGAWWFVERVFL